MESASPATTSQPPQAVKKRATARLVFVSIAVVVLLGAIGWLILRQAKLSRARHDVALLVLGLDGFAREHGQYPAGTPAQICALLRGEKVDGQNPRRLDYISADVGETNAAGDFVDPWGTPYVLLTSPHARAYSCGPNRVDEQGKGDDVSSGG